MVLSAFLASYLAPKCTQLGTAAAISRSKEELRLIYLTIAEALCLRVRITPILLLSESSLGYNGGVFFDAMSDAKYIYRLMGPSFIFLRPSVPDVKQQVGPYVHRGIRATVQVTIAHLCQLSMC